MKSIAGVVLSIFLVMAPTWRGSAQAQEIPPSTVILEVSGAIALGDGNGTVRYDLKALDQLEQGTVRTVTPWTDGPQVFEGPLGSALLKDVGAEGDEIRATALNDYTVTIPVHDLENYGVILATRRGGSVLTIRNRGPIWIIYPWSDRPELKKDVFFARSIWQLRSLEVLRK